MDHDHDHIARPVGMTQPDPTRTPRLHALSSDNRHLTDAPVGACCFHCLAYFGSAQIYEVTDDGRTVTCPFCGIDSVIPAQGIDHETLASMHATYFSVEQIG